MNYELIYTRRAKRDIKRLDEETKLRIKKQLEFLLKSPLTYAEKLTNSTLGDYHFRVGDFRIIFDIDENNMVILRVGHMREIYRRR
jgi:mRNA interferase RelE/StbE